MEIASSPRIMEEIFKIFSARRSGVVCALTRGNFTTYFLSLWLIDSFFIFFFFQITDVDELYRLYDPRNYAPCRSNFVLFSYIRLVSLANSICLFPKKIF